MSGQKPTYYIVSARSINRAVWERAMTKVRQPILFIDTGERELGDPSTKAQWSFWTFKLAESLDGRLAEAQEEAQCFPVLASSGTSTPVRWA